MEAEARSERLYPRARSTLIVAVVIGVLVGVVIVILATGGSNAPAERRGDLIYTEGVTPKNREGGDLVGSIADVIGSEIRRTDTGLALSARVATKIPQPLQVSELEFRWDLVAKDGATWTVAITIGKTTEARVLSSAGFGAGTIDDTLIGGAQVLDDSVEVRFDFREVPDFPDTFGWSLSTTLRAFRTETDSPRVKDRFPDEGSRDFEG